MASSMIIFYNKLDGVVTTILKISSKTFKIFRMDKTCYGLCLNIWETEIEISVTLLFEGCILVLMYVSFPETFFWS